VKSGLSKLAHQGSAEDCFSNRRGHGLISIVESDIGHVRPIARGKTVSKLFALEPLGLALSEKQMPQIVETIRSVEN
jgi:hypothetical protein